ncbi:MAG: DUF4834 family protein [Mediterranea sp.]|jgi:hypothetical protein|nr:DUF4834 family protein [Mediterranea sp.]
MLGFLGMLAVLFFIVVFIGLSLIGSIFRALFGWGGRNRSTGNASTGRTYDDASQTSKSAGNSGKPKIFTSEEGEYVEFEEIEEEKEER